MATRRKKAKARDEALANIDDGCDSWLVEGARFDGALEIPVIERPEKIVVPSALVPSAATRPRRSRRRSS